MNKLIYKILALLFLYININATPLHTCISNIIGERNYQINKFLILDSFKNEQSFYIGTRLKYKEILEVLKNKGLLNFKFDNPQKIQIVFSTKSSANKLIKIIKDTLSTLGYSYYFTDYLKRSNSNIIWEISFRSESMLNPHTFIKELEKLEVVVLDMEKINDFKWKYEIDLNYARIPNTIVVQNNEKIKLRKPHQAYMLEISEANTLEIISKRLNSWHPRVSFYDESLNVLASFEKETEYKGIKIVIPNFTKYILVDDTYTLINIKRGLIVIVR